MGSGAREHALAWGLQYDDPDVDVIAAPGNPGIAQDARVVAVPATDIAALIALAERERPDFTLVGPEAPLAAGIVDQFRDRKLPIFGPTQAAAQIETSKAFAKQVMQDAGVPTARAEVYCDPQAAKAALKNFDRPPVIKASGLAAGKGVIVSGSVAEASEAIDQMLTNHVFGSAGHEILIEEFMQGEEVSVFGITDGQHVVPLIPAQDHKRLLDGDRGPNTGGMGAYAPYTNVDVNDVVQRIMLPTLDAMRARGCAFQGLLYAGLMLTPEGAKVVEFNCRFGDPETEAIVPLLPREFRDLLHTVAKGGTLSPTGRFAEASRRAVTTVVAASGYPEQPRTGDPITLPDIPHNVHLFHAGTKMSATGDLVTNGGRVFAVTAVADTIAQAQIDSAAVAAAIDFPGKQYRSDIGWRALL